ncbi:phospholipase C/P1 nuclease [Agrocybe pediades]|nr:phospholipase C/P1 nuclease [Agrocybe pediades]
MRLSAFTVLIPILSYLDGATAWGAVGHEVVATIAQMYLHPTVLPKLCEILDFAPGECHIASVATWADQHRMQMRWSASLHYVGALDDYPSKTCAFPGSRGWAGSRQINVLDGIRNTSSLLQGWVNHDVNDNVAEEALKFLIHFVGDMHQPLHLTGRDRGGNSVKVRFGRRVTNLHSLWDGFLIAKAVREVPRNYSRPLPYPKVERALRGTIYDSYIRRLLWEGLLNPWATEAESWLGCPTPSTTDGSLSSSGLLGMMHNAYYYTGKLVQSIIKDGVEIIPDSDTICPYAWSKPIHKLNCDLIWPKEIDEPPYNTVSFDDSFGHDHSHGDHEVFMEDESKSPLLNLDTPEYAGRVYREMIIEKLLAQGGIRLAGLLNYLFADYDDDTFGPRRPFITTLNV